MPVARHQRRHQRFTSGIDDHLRSAADRQAHLTSSNANGRKVIARRHQRRHQRFTSGIDDHLRSAADRQAHLTSSNANGRKVIARIDPGCLLHGINDVIAPPAQTR